jgi:hypothetical protein
MTETQTPEKKVQRSTVKDVEKYETLLEHARFVRKDDTKDAKKYFYRIMSLHPRSLGLSPEDFVCQFNVQKFYRDDFKIDTINGQKVRKNKQVAQMDEDGQLLDAYASFFMDAPEFLEKFESEK